MKNTVSGTEERIKVGKLRKETRSELLHMIVGVWASGGEVEIYYV